MWKKISILLEMIKFEHTVFAMPFALMGAFLAQRGLPACQRFFLGGAGHGWGAHLCHGVQPDRGPAI